MDRIVFSLFLIIMNLNSYLHAEVVYGHFWYEEKKINTYSNLPLNDRSNEIKNMVIIIDDVGTYNTDILKLVMENASSLNKDKEVLIINPKFKTFEDELLPEDLFWAKDGWQVGNSSNNHLNNTSSFKIIDSLITAAKNLFPQLASISIVGHGKAAVFVNLYALTTKTPNALQHIDFKFIMLNAPNYTYLNRHRPNPQKNGVFTEPFAYLGKTNHHFKKFNHHEIKKYHNYPYGLYEKNSYADMSSNQELTKQFLQRDVFYFVGEKNKVRDQHLGSSHPAKLQGKDRFERATNYYNYLNKFFMNNHQLTIVPDVGNDDKAMYKNKNLNYLLFEM